MLEVKGDEVKQSIGDLMSAYADSSGYCDSDGSVNTGITGVRYFRLRKPHAREPMLYDKGIIIVGQGHKIGHVGEKTFRYDANHYLVLGMPIPFECETHASPEEPLQALAIDIDLQLLGQLVNQMGSGSITTDDELAPRAIEAVAMDQSMEDAVCRMLRALCSDTDAQVLGDALVAEIIYRVLQGPRGSVLLGLARQEGYYARIAATLNAIHQQYQQPLTVESLATDAGMSVSSFHRAFKQVTTESPLQYLKKVRLNKARGLIELEGERASVAARAVGYESPSQFSREFKRYFQCSPTDFRRSAE